MDGESNISENIYKKCEVSEGVVTIEIEFHTEENAKAVYKSLLPEAKNPPTYRSVSKISLNGKTLKIKISSKDLVSLRAALNSYFRWLYTIVMSMRVIEDVSG